MSSEPVRKAIGLCITLDAPDGLFLDKWREMIEANPPTEKAVDVSIRYGDKTAEMTFEEFLKRVGLIEAATDKCPSCGIPRSCLHYVTD